MKLFFARSGSVVVLLLLLSAVFPASANSGNTGSPAPNAAPTYIKVMAFDAKCGYLLAGSSRGTLLLQQQGNSAYTPARGDMVKGVKLGNPGESVITDTHSGNTMQVYNADGWLSTDAANTKFSGFCKQGRLAQLRPLNTEPVASRSGSMLNANGSTRVTISAFNASCGYLLANGKNGSLLLRTQGVSAYEPAKGDVVSGSKLDSTGITIIRNTRTNQAMRVYNSDGWLDKDVAATKYASACKASGSASSANTAWRVTVIAYSSSCRYVLAEGKKGSLLLQQQNVSDYMPAAGDILDDPQFDSVGVSTATNIKTAQTLSVYNAFGWLGSSVGNARFGALCLDNADQNIPASSLTPPSPKSTLTITPTYCSTACTGTTCATNNSSYVTTSCTSPTPNLPRH